MKTDAACNAFLAQVLKNFAEYGFNYRSVHYDDGEADHGLSITDTVANARSTDAVHLKLTHTKERSRKIGLLIVTEPGQVPMDIVADYGAANENDVAIADRCSQGAPLA
jgi:hypothetical protein